MFRVKVKATKFNDVFSEGTVLEVKEFKNWDYAFEFVENTNNDALQEVIRSENKSQTRYAIIERMKTPRQKLADAGDKIFVVKQAINLDNSYIKTLEEALRLIDEVRDDIK